MTKDLERAKGRALLLVPSVSDPAFPDVFANELAKLEYVFRGTSTQNAQVVASLRQHVSSIVGLQLAGNVKIDFWGGLPY